MNIKKNILTSLLFLAIISSNAYATKLPEDVWKYVKNNLPNSQQRFDGVVIVSDNVMYIPLLPLSLNSVDTIKPDYTYPQGQNLNQLPEVVLLNNGYSLLKVFKDKDGNYTLTKKDDLPTKIRLGMMPQDMLVPAGLKIPESLKLTLGDLLIPSKDEKTLAINGEEKTKNSYTGLKNKNEFVPLVELKTKKIIINPKNSKFLEIYDNTSKNPLYELKLTSMPLKIITSDVSKVALVLYWSGKNIEIIDLKDERVIANIPIDANATDVVLNKEGNIAYVSSQNANSIYEINLNSMQLTSVIRLDQKPSKLAYSNEDNTITFFDEISSKVYSVKKVSGEYNVFPVGSASNISKVFADEKYIYAISRIQSQISVFDKTEGKLLYNVSTDKKPIDAIKYKGKIFILCAKEGYMDVYDIAKNEIITREKLANEGFYSNITLIPSENNILITGINAKNYLLYNLDTMKLVKKQDSYIDVANIIILDKNQRL